MLRSVFDYEGKRIELHSLNIEMNGNAKFWDDIEKAQMWGIALIIFIKTFLN